MTPWLWTRDVTLPQRRCGQLAGRVRGSRSDEGSILIITFIFLIMVSLVVVTLSNWATNGLNNTRSFQSADNSLYAANGATQVAMRAARYTYPVSNSEICPGTPSPIDINGVYVQVWCTTVENLGVTTRQTTLSACKMPDATTQLTGPCMTESGSVRVLLVAVVDFNDTTANSNPYNPNCTSTNQSTCGAMMAIVSWESR